MKARDIFAVTLKSIGFAWQTNRRLLIIVLLLNVFQGSVVYLQFSTFSAIVNQIVKIKQGEIQTDELIRQAIILGLSFLIPTLLTNVVSHFRIKFRMQQSLHLELYKIEKQGGLDIGTIETNSYQSLLRGAQEWGSGSVINVQDFIFTSATSLGGIVTSMFVLWSLNGWLVLFGLLAVAPIYFFYKKYSLEVFRIRHFSIDDQRIINNRISHFEELQKAVDVILLKLKDRFSNEIRDRKLSYNDNVLVAERKKHISYGVLSLWYLTFLFAAIALMTREALTGTMAVGGLLLAFNTYTRFYQTVNGYVESISFTEEAARYAARWFELFDLKPKIASKADSIRISSQKPPLIEFKNVSFQYPSAGKTNPVVLKNISFTISPGEKIAIVGVNGSGKTTLIKLLCRIYDVTEGSVLIDGVELRDLKLEDWQNSIGVLFQDFPVYNLKIRDSISIGRADQTLDENRLKEAARFSGADEFISDYNQLIWKEFNDGIDLSKGQHQRLAVARMFYRNAAITILDEPTASIDAVTEEKIFTSLEENMENKTVILITHRFSTVKNADKILMFENGEIIEQGTHRELMHLNGKYSTLFTMQANRYLEEAREKVI